VKDLKATATTEVKTVQRERPQANWNLLVKLQQKAVLSFRFTSLFINSPSLMTEILGEFRALDLGLICAGALIYFAIMLSSWYKNIIIFVLAKIIFIAPLAFIAIQFLRQQLVPNETLTLTELIVSAVFMAGISFAFTKIGLTRPLESICQITTDFFRSNVRIG
jgi:ABC-type Fe3+-siderophore transport system permease subunit